ncbi:DUF484 domain-containing protein [Stutzerimonas kirkiae]|uniref:DUF484 domain-containing protein n=1 Tax=Stutzerimonas kirkiae TaxID=2211392 RepID=A0A4Q9R5J0_9GAMM|nr:DUF484 family protein [Stutzerimonas kirkiae]TBU95757.1 DUF484 domain-containing protein [Stutzerimonas kirkiae]TBV02748.1 DUF484 domain-containing protein [Stutzerimonas kirkiae]TBV13261.1 DUF484 domain-containing protein [Stutzerimonas kirkiae]
MSENRDTPENISAEAVVAYLRAHPEFFVDHDELIPELRIPHLPGSAVSLVERQVKLLRERNIEMRNRLAHLMDVARDNDRLFEKTRRLVLDMLDADGLEELIGAVEDSLRHEFQVPYVSLILFSDTTLPVGRSVSGTDAQQAIGGLLGNEKTLCGVLRPHELSFLFGEEDSSDIGSAAMVCLAQQQGILAIGSPDPQHYKSSMGTLFLSYIAEVLSRTLPRHATPLRSVR